MRQVYAHHFHERMWHGVQALSILGLMLTGVEIHWPQTVHVLGFAAAGQVHEWLGVALFVNAILGLLYHVFSERLQEYIPRGPDRYAQAMKQIRHYTWGIFHGEKHLPDEAGGSKFNILQQLTYLAILNVLLPFQVFTGLVLLGSRYNTWLSETFRDLPGLGPLHLIGAFAFVSFLFGHLYLATTGHTPTSHFRAIVTGFDHIPEEKETEA